MPMEQREKMRWTDRFKPVFQVDVEISSACSDAGNRNAVIKDSLSGSNILNHVDSKSGPD